MFLTGKVEYRGSEPALAWRESGKAFRKNHPSSPERDLSLNLPVIGSLVKHEYSALTNSATEAHLRGVIVENHFGKKNLSTPNRDFNPNLSVIDSLVQHENDTEEGTGNIYHKSDTFRSHGLTYEYRRAVSLVSILSGQAQSIECDHRAADTISRP
uniref:Uncharacterized protein n=1 Tax=Timema shepardi TaxID=629360 RepID=A0A7R9B0I3_TIMSH|nr:unnamed protein product [Timema shepardi]